MMGLEEEGSRTRSIQRSQELMQEFRALFPDGVLHGIQEGWLEHTRQRIEDEMFEADMNDVGDAANIRDRLQGKIYMMLLDEVSPESRRFTSEKNQKIQKLANDYALLVVNRG